MLSCLHVRASSSDSAIVTERLQYFKIPWNNRLKKNHGGLSVPSSPTLPPYELLTGLPAGFQEDLKLAVLA